MKSLLRFYKSNTNVNQLVDIVAKNSKISLRVIDYLCTNYAKTHDVVYYIDKKPFNLYLQYRSQLKAYSKKQFDPFRRHERITIPVPESILPEGKLETTVAQLNFFKWAIEKKVISFLEKKDNYDKIEKGMTTELLVKNSNSKKKVVPVSKHNCSLAKRHNIHVTVTFK